MTGSAAVDGIDRRTFLLGASGAAALVAWMAASRTALAQAPKLAVKTAAQQAEDNINGWKETLARITRDAKPIDADLTFDVPEIAENGNTVPFTVAVESPMTEPDHVRAIHVIATANPIAHIASFEFTLASGKAAVTGRMRLLHTQDVLMVAEFGNGAFAVSRREVKVTIGGCGGG